LFAFQLELTDGHQMSEIPRRWSDYHVFEFFVWDLLFGLYPTERALCVGLSLITLAHFRFVDRTGIGKNWSLWITDLFLRQKGVTPRKSWQGLCHSQQTTTPFEEICFCFCSRYSCPRDMLLSPPIGASWICRSNPVNTTSYALSTNCVH